MSGLLRLLWQLGWGFLQRLKRRRLLLMAAALSYFLFLSAIPGFLLFVSIGSYLLGSHERAASALSLVLRHLFPATAASGGDALVRAAQGLLANRGVVSGLSALALVWIGATFFDALEMSLNMVWDVPGDRDRPFHWRKLHSIALVLGAAVMAWVSFGITTGMAVAGEAVQRAAPDWEALFHVSQAGAALVAILLAALTFAVFYVVLPNRRVEIRPAIVGALTAAVLWELAKIAFNRLMGAAQGYQPVYGSVATLVVTLMWLYFTSVVILLGGHVAAGLQLRAGGAAPRHTAAGPESTPGRGARRPREERRLRLRQLGLRRRR